MTLAELICQFRHDADDFVESWRASDEDRLWLNEELLHYAQDALDEYARRRPIRDMRSPLCRIAVTASRASYPLSDRILALDGVSLDGRPLVKTFRAALDERHPCWRDARGTPEFYLEEPDELRLQLYPAPVLDAQLLLNIRRLIVPLLSMEGLDKPIPDVPFDDQRALIDWMLYRAFSKEDVDTQDLSRAAVYQQAFNQKVGGVRLSSRGDTVRRDLAGWLPKTTSYY